MYIITGSTGLIGSSASDYFLKKKHKVIGIDKPSNDIDVKFILPITTFEFKFFI